MNGPLVNGKHKTHAVTGAVTVIRADFPDRGPRERVELAAVGAQRKAGRCQRNMASVKSRFIASVGLPQMTVRVTSVVPPSNCPPLSTKSSDSPVSFAAEPAFGV